MMFLCLLLLLPSLYLCSFCRPGVPKQKCVPFCEPMDSSPCKCFWTNYTCSDFTDSRDCRDYDCHWEFDFPELNAVIIYGGRTNIDIRKEEVKGGTRTSLLFFIYFYFSSRLLLGRRCDDAPSQASFFLVSSRLIIFLKTVVCTSLNPWRSPVNLSVNVIL